MRNQPEIRTSILDRLIDQSPELTGEPILCHAGSLNSVMESVLRDLEHLLNARRYIRPLSESHEQVRASIVSYGARDFISENPRSTAVRQRIRLEVERLLMRFEPRLKNVIVRLDNSEVRERTLRFRITALLLADPITTPITFDTRLDINSGAYSIFQ